MLQIKCENVYLCTFSLKTIAFCTYFLLDYDQDGLLHKLAVKNNVGHEGRTKILLKKYFTKSFNGITIQNFISEENVI